MFSSKNGVSAVVATVLIVMITVAAVGLLWAIVSPFLKSNIADKTACVDAEISISIDEGSKYTCVSADNKTAVRVKRGSDENIWKAVQIVYTDISGNSQIVSYKNPPAINSEKVYRNNNTKNIVKISVVPILEGVGDDLVCSKTIETAQIKECSAEVTEGITETSDLYDDEAPVVETPVITGLSSQQSYDNTSLNLAFTILGNVDTVWVNDSNFDISGEYSLINTTEMSSGNHSLNVSVNNSLGEMDSEIINIEVLQSSLFDASLLVGLVGYWPLDETGGEIAVDYSGSGNNGTLVGGVLVNQVGKVGQAYRFDGSNDIVNVGGVDSEVVGLSQLTYSTWINTDTIDTSNNRVVFSNTDSGAAQAEIYYASNGNITFCDNTDDEPSGWCPGKFGYALSADTWYMLTAVFNGTHFNSYVNGEKQLQTFTVNGRTERQGSEKEMGIGGRVSSIWYMKNWDGLIDEPAIWNRSLSASEISQLYNGGEGISLIS